MSYLAHGVPGEINTSVLNRRHDVHRLVVSLSGKGSKFNHHVAQQIRLPILQYVTVWNQSSDCRDVSGDSWKTSSSRHGPHWGGLLSHQCRLPRTLDWHLPAACSNRFRDGFHSHAGLWRVAVVTTRQHRWRILLQKHFVCTYEAQTLSL